MRAVGRDVEPVDEPAQQQLAVEHRLDVQLALGRLEPARVLEGEVAVEDLAAARSARSRRRDPRRRTSPRARARPRAAPPTAGTSMSAARSGVRSAAGRSKRSSSTLCTTVPRTASGDGCLGQPVDGAEAVHQRAGHEVARPARRERTQHVDPVDRASRPARRGRCRRRRPAEVRGDRHVAVTLGDPTDTRLGRRDWLGSGCARACASADPTDGIARRQRPPARSASARSPGIDVLVTVVLVHRRGAHRLRLRAPDRAGRARAGRLEVRRRPGLRGHALPLRAAARGVARRHGAALRATASTSITLHFLGGMTEIDGAARKPRQEFWIAVVGPLTSIAVGLVAARRCGS